MYSLCAKPSLVSKVSKARKMTKNHYHRDDPAFMVLQILFITLTTLAYGLTCGTVMQTALMIVYDVLVGYLLAGAIFASVTWVIVNRFFISTGNFGEAKTETDWQYSFDVHCNGFFTYFMWTKVAQFILFPIAIGDSSLAQVLANGLHMVGIATYFHNVCLGYLELPMLVRQERLAYPIPIVVVLFTIITLFSSWNSSYWSISRTWGYTGAT